MTRYFLLIILILLLGSRAWGYSRGSFFVQSQVIGKDAGKEEAKEAGQLAAELEEQIISKIEYEYPCARITSKNIISRKLLVEKEKEMLGWYIDCTGRNPEDCAPEPEIKRLQEELKKRMGKGAKRYDSSEDSITDLAQQVAGSFLINIKISFFLQQMILNLTCYNLKEKKGVFNQQEVLAPGINAKGVSEKMAKAMVEELIYEEICPFKGKVTVSVNSQQETKEKTQHPVYCNETDQQFIRNRTFTKTSRNRWDLQRNGNPDTSGDMNLSVLERDEENEENGCYRCPSGREGGRTSKKVTTIKSILDGMSSISIDPNAPKIYDSLNRDATVKLIFNKNGTYMVKVEAVSEFGKYEGSINEIATGTCDVRNSTKSLSDDGVVEERQNRKEPHLRSVPLNGIWGPFPGSPKDKKLSGTKENKLDRPDIHETGSQTIEFDLTRK